MQYSKKLLVCYCLLLPFFAIAQQKAQVDAVLAPYIENQTFSGVVLLATDGKITYSRAAGFRDIANQKPIKKNDLFELASVSKQFTSMVILMLYEKGLLQLDDLVEKYLSIPYKNITIRHLLTHTSGLPDYQAIMDEHWDKSKVADNDDILEYLHKYAPPTRFAPGTQYEYSNTGYVLLASIAEKASGRGFTEICRQDIFQKLGMEHTDLRTPAERSAIENFAKGYIPDSAAGRLVAADSFPSSNYTIWLGHREGPGRISSTAQDLLKWDQALTNNLLIQNATLQLAYTPMELADGKLSFYGFGWDILDNSPNHKVVGHNGDNPGYKTQIIRSLFNNKTLIVLSNSAPLEFTALIRDLKNLITQ
ncbi:MAG: serine hydrolase domain-containing protein [Chitinophagia bacterium]